jgi:hypothetical protein
VKACTKIMWNNKEVVSSISFIPERPLVWNKLDCTSHHPWRLEWQWKSSRSKNQSASSGLSVRTALESKKRCMNISAANMWLRHRGSLVTILLLYLLGKSYTKTFNLPTGLSSSTSPALPAGKCCWLSNS